MPSHAIITGGSSGIGFATASRLVSRGFSVSLLARNQVRLEAAQSSLRKIATNNAQVHTYQCDVRNASLVQNVISQAVAVSGPPSWAVASAGIVRPGTFLTQSVEVHEEQIQTNYLGSTYFAKAVVPHMKDADKGKLVFIASGAAFIGLFGYSSYGPSKFAVRSLAESLRVELRPSGISVTLVCPGDTNTPQHTEELLTRPKITSLLAEGGRLLSADAVAEKLIRSAEKGQFLVTFGWQLHVLGYTHSLIGPLVRGYQHWLVNRYGKDP